MKRSAQQICASRRACHDYGDLPLAVLFTSQQIVIETYICPVNTIRDTAEFNLFLLRN
ncbi:DUF2170 family protein, partial [Salmonella enterica subsp. enterica serovar Montevideo]|nr:DUF2170 family protein [Salmonella enterica subsp. enterica serovar Montevideo]